jgi:hypothetical protein
MEIIDIMKQLSNNQTARHEIINEVFSAMPEFAAEIIDLDQRVVAAEAKARKVLGAESTYADLWTYMIKEELSYYDCVLASQSNEPLQAAFIQKAQALYQEKQGMADGEAEIGSDSDGDWISGSSGQWDDVPPHDDGSDTSGSGEGGNTGLS